MQVHCHIKKTIFLILHVATLIVDDYERTKFLLSIFLLIFDPLTPPKCGKLFIVYFDFLLEK